jgi:protein tyrosine/serine phosphatase
MPPLTAQLPPAPSRPSWRRAALRGVALGLLLVVAAEVGGILLGPNFHVVIPGAVYRCANPSPAFLEQTVKAHGIRTVLNLRGCSEPEEWYLDECRTTARLDVCQEDVSMSAGRLPAVPTIRELVRILDGAQYPILIHCHKGIDRTGLASAMVLLLHTDTPLAVARRQLSPRFGHMPLGRSGHLDRFFDLYEEWLQRKGLEHSRSNFRRFAECEYQPGECSCLLEVIQAPGPSFPKDQLITLTIRCHNTSVKPWYLKPGTDAGVHLCYHLFDAGDREVAHGRAGLLRSTVHPDSYIDLTIDLPALPRGGRYQLRADMMDGTHALFFQTGSAPLLLDLEVP